MEFWKMNGAGNDFVVLNNMDGSIDPKEYGYLAKTLCHRHLSVGADGLMVVEQPTMGGDYRMAFYNSDGSHMLKEIILQHRVGLFENGFSCFRFQRFAVLSENGL